MIVFNEVLLFFFIPKLLLDISFPSSTPIESMRQILKILSQVNFKQAKNSRATPQNKKETAK